MVHSLLNNKQISKKVNVYSTAIWQPVQVTYKASVYMTKVCGKSQVSEGARSGCSCSRWVSTYVLFIVLRVRVNTRSSLLQKVNFQNGQNNNEQRLTLSGRLYVAMLKRF